MLLRRVQIHSDQVKLRMPHNLFNTLQKFDLGKGKYGRFYSLPELERQGIGPISKLPVSIRIVLESVLRNCDGVKVKEDDIRALSNWEPSAERTAEIPFIVARIVLQDFTGVPLLVDLAAMRSTVAGVGKNPKLIEPLVPVDLVVDHSVQVDFAGTSSALQHNMEIEFQRNRQRYEFLKWGMQAFKTFKVVPPGIGIVHQVNLEYLAKGILERDGVSYPDTLVGTDSHTTMINGLGVVGWGVGGIEAEAGMLGQPVYFLTPDVLGVHLRGRMREGVTATDLVLHITEMLRKAKVVGKFVEYFGEGASSLSVTDRATIANMAPEYGATMGFFGVDEETCRYLRFTGRSDDQVNAFKNYFKAQGMFGIPREGEVSYSQVLELNLAEITPNVAGPKRPQDRIELPLLKERFLDLLVRPVADNGYGKSLAELSRRFEARIGVHGSLAEPLTGGGEQRAETAPIARSDSLSVKNTNTLTEIEMMNNRPTPDRVERAPAEDHPVALADLGHGDVLIAAITSCTNTSNPSVMLAAGILAKKAVEKGLRVKPQVKTSLAPGSRVVSDYLEKTGLQTYLDRLGFQLVGYGCTTCIGNSGPLDPKIEEVVTANDLIAASVLSGNRNFEARVHQSIKANFLMSPPLVVAFALAGRVDIDLTKEPIGRGDNEDIYLRDIWPSQEEIAAVTSAAVDPDIYRELYSDFTAENPLWNDIPSMIGDVYEWDEESTYIQEPPFFQDFTMKPAGIAEIKGARPLGIFGDSVTTDHISPAGSIKTASPAGQYLIARGVEPRDFNSYGSRRGNDRVMTRGTFANVRIKNLMVQGTEGGVTKYYPGGEQMSIYDAAMKYQAEGIPLVIIAGQEYGTGSSRDWAAKGTRLLGVKAVIAKSYERIHRSNLVGMGVLPLQFKEGSKDLDLDGTETFDIVGLDGQIKPRQDLTLVINRANGAKEEVLLTLRIDTPIEIEYYQHGGILPYVLRQLIAQG
jgi:aconitate hydratase